MFMGMRYLTLAIALLFTSPAWADTVIYRCTTHAQVTWGEGTFLREYTLNLILEKSAGLVVPFGGGVPGRAVAPIAAKVSGIIEIKDQTRLSPHSVSHQIYGYATRWPSESGGMSLIAVFHTAASNPHPFTLRSDTWIAEAPALLMDASQSPEHPKSLVSIGVCRRVLR